MSSTISEVIQRTNVSNKVEVGGKLVGEGEPTFIIAEVGANHNGDLELAKRLIREAWKAGADAVKLQKRSLPHLLTKEMMSQPKDSPFGNTYGEYREKLEFGKDEYVELKKFADDLGILFFATPFDIPSTDFLEDIGVSTYKIASFDVTNTALLEYIAKKGKPIFMSVGMATEEEVDQAVETILAHNSRLIIKHCISVYPTPYEHMHLRNIEFLKRKYYPIPVGYSGHEQDILPTLLAVGAGACVVERHVTVDKSLPGPDHATVSLDMYEFEHLVSEIRRVEKAMGHFRKELFEDEARIREKHGKSITSKVAIPAGTTITKDMLTVKNPGTGLPPYKTDELVGKVAKEDIADDAIIPRQALDW
jgi:sialic acid synthase SpsE|tara:strand:- start:753 stop:1841 length:1089 start_codon:yes stop_codon:yes gene_type:complete